MSMYKIFYRSFEQEFKAYYNYYYYFYNYYNKRLLGALIRHGKKLWAFNFLVKVSYELKKIFKVSPHIIMLVVFCNVTPLTILYPKKLGGIIYRVPRSVTLRKQRIGAIRSIVKVLKDLNKTRSIVLEDFVSNLVNIINNKGLSLETRRLDYLYSDSNRHLIRKFKD